MVMTQSQSAVSELRAAIEKAYRMDEDLCVEELLRYAELTPKQLESIDVRARELMENVRSERRKSKGLESFLYEYDLSSDEGIALMCMAEALLRIPDKSNIDNLIRDKITSADWASHLGTSSSTAVNAATWGLMLTGKVLEQNPYASTVSKTIKHFITRSSEPVIRSAVGQAMKIMSKQFVMGRNIEEALKRAQTNESIGYRYSYDMLGEGAKTAEDAERYLQAYSKAIESIGKAANNKGVIAGPGISIKLSALHPRYEIAKRERVLAELVPKLFMLARQAKEANIALTVDAEESYRLQLSLDVIEKVFSDPGLDGWEGFGLALQSYQKRAFFVIDWLAQLARRNKRRMMVRLIKGAYWDSEIKDSQENGYENYPVFTRKASTDVSFLACAKKLMTMPDAFFIQFATHNAYSVACVLELMQGRTDYEFQCLHGMGETLYKQIVPKDKLNLPCRIYAPVGSHEDLLPYLVRRLLENGANTSFVNRIVDEDTPIENLIEDPVKKMKAIASKQHPNIPLPKAIFIERLNSNGMDLTSDQEVSKLYDGLEKAASLSWSGSPIVNGQRVTGVCVDAYAPFDRQKKIGTTTDATVDQVETALASAYGAKEAWDATAAEERASILERMADLMERERVSLMHLAIMEAGKTIPDAVAEIREAVDFCRYYAQEARKHFSTPTQFFGYTGEENQLSLHGRGVMVCISPWNFPAAIFVGQVSAALVAGNPVIAKPAEQTPLMATRLVELFFEAGVPHNVLHVLPGRGEIIGAKLVDDKRVAGVIFTGSTETARIINQSLAKREGPIVPLIAETGGQNTMIVDSSALLEQVTQDVLKSSFYSAGQRCSALRVLFIQEEIADKFIVMLTGAMKELSVGNPGLLSTDIGPVIDADAKAMLEKHRLDMLDKAKLIHELPLDSACDAGTFFAPAAFELTSLSDLTKEIFGPILHVVRFKRDELEKVVDQINALGYGLTCGIHSRIDETIDYIKTHLIAGNCYVNRNMTGAVVGLQPFGGEGLSGTGPKAGGPHYLLRLCTERTRTVNTTAAGGNASLMSLDESVEKK